MKVNCYLLTLVIGNGSIYRAFIGSNAYIRQSIPF